MLQSSSLESKPTVSPITTRMFHVVWKCSLAILIVAAFTPFFVLFHSTQSGVEQWAAKAMPISLSNNAGQRDTKTLKADAPRPQQDTDTHETPTVDGSMYPENVTEDDSTRSKDEKSLEPSKQSDNVNGNEKSEKVPSLPKNEAAGSATTDPPQRVEEDVIRLMRQHCVTKDSLKKTLIYTVANMGNYDMLQNWMESMSRTKHTTYFILTFDVELFEALKAKGITAVAMVPLHWLSENGKTVSGKAQNWDTPGYFRLTKSKNNIARKILGHGINILYSDVDTVWTSTEVLTYVNFYMEQRRWLDAAFALDHPFPAPENRDPSVNTGFYYARATRRVMNLFDEAIKQQDRKVNTHDQDSMYLAIMSNGADAIRWVGFFDSVLVMNGRHFIKESRHKSYGVLPFVVHANYFIGQKDKRDKFKEFGLWYLPSWS